MYYFFILGGSLSEQMEEED